MEPGWGLKGVARSSCHVCDDNGLKWSMGKKRTKVRKIRKIRNRMKLDLELMCKREESGPHFRCVFLYFFCPLLLSSVRGALAGGYDKKRQYANATGLKTSIQRTDSQHFATVKKTLITFKGLNWSVIGSMIAQRNGLFSWLVSWAMRKHYFFYTKRIHSFVETKSTYLSNGNTSGLYQCNAVN